MNIVCPNVTGESCRKWIYLDIMLWKFECCRNVLFIIRGVLWNTTEKYLPRQKSLVIARSPLYLKYFNIRYEAVQIIWNGKYLYVPIQLQCVMIPITEIVYLVQRDGNNFGWQFSLADVISRTEYEFGRASHRSTFPKQWRLIVHERSFFHDDVIKWKHFRGYWPFMRGIHRYPVNSPHKGQWRGALMFSLLCVWINGWVNNREAGDLRRYRAHYDVTLM